MMFDGALVELKVSRQQFNFRYRSAAHFIEVFRTWYGPVHKAFTSLEPEAASALERELTQLLEENNSPALRHWWYRVNTLRW
ncbi:hypothetical protein DBADOPDK_02714 [Pseudomonas sp. MM223]|nr:hypothetical protein DBADOPDK_02714 [Pseudomonas sp. MM223]